MSLRFFSSLFVVLFLVACGGTPMQQTETSDARNTPLPQTVASDTASSAPDTSVSSSTESSSGSVATTSVTTSSDNRVEKPSLIPGSPEDFAASQTPRVFFETNEHFISNKAARTLRQQARWLRKYPETRIVIEGNADERGTREYNYALGNRRALAVRDFLISQGIPTYRIRTVSYGKDKPEFIGSNPTAWSLNRRAITVIEK